jgi:hypothetical protein
MTVFCSQSLTDLRLRIALWLAIGVSALLAKPLHELEHSGPGVKSGGVSCSCGHLHSAHKVRGTAVAGSPNVPAPVDPASGHQHDECQICLTLWLQTPFVLSVPEVQPAGIMLDSILLVDDKSGTQLRLTRLARGPPAV